MLKSLSALFLSLPDYGPSFPAGPIHVLTHTVPARQEAQERKQAFSISKLPELVRQVPNDLTVSLRTDNWTIVHHITQPSRYTTVQPSAQPRKRTIKWYKAIKLFLWRSAEEVWLVSILSVQSSREEAQEWLFMNFVKFVANFECGVSSWGSNIVAEIDTDAQTLDYGISSWNKDCIPVQ